MLRRFVILGASLLLISASEPPVEVPVPQAKPEQTEVPAAPPAPAQAPADNKQQTPAQPAPEPPVTEPTPPTAPPQQQPPATDAPTPTEKPEVPADPDKPDTPKTDEKAEEPAPEPVQAEDPAELQACMSALKEIGAEFKPVDPINDGEGCGIASPVELSTILPGIKLEPAGTMRCEAALQLARWTKEMIVPAARISMPDRKVTGLANASTYICRNRNSATTGKISEHAKGSAVDISTLSFDKGEPLVMKPRDEDGTPEGAFQRTITTAACLFFKTVLSPGSDATHQDHLHLDVLERKGGYLYCR
jgi:hypothetical protein